MTVAAIAAAIERPAAACGSGGESDVDQSLTLFGASVLLDVGFTVHDLVVDDSSTGYAAAETLLTLPQLLIAADLMDMTADDPSSQKWVMAYGAWAGVLAIHGIYELIEGEPAPPAPETPPPIEHRGPPGATSSFRMRAAPTMVVDSRGDAAPGMGLVGRF